MKKQLINEAFRLQQLAGIQPINLLKEDTPGFHDFMDSVDDMFEPGSPENEKLADAVMDALYNGDISPMPHEPGSYYRQVADIAKELGLAVNTLNEELEGYSYYYDFNGNKSDEDNVVNTSVEFEDLESIKLANGKIYNIGDEEPEEGGEIIAIKKWPNGYEIASEMGRDEDEYQTNYKR